MRDLDPRRPLLIETKLNVPRLPRHCVSRAAQLARLQQGLERKLTVVVAPAGFGKTTLLAEWCRQLHDAGHAVAWVSVDADDDSLAQISAYVIAALHRAAEAAARHAAQLLADDPLAPAKLVLSVLLNDLTAYGQPVVLVLDDIDRLDAPPIHEALFSLLRYAPDNLHVVLAGRTQPAVPLSYFRLRDQLTLIDADQLRFDAEQARRFFAEAAGASVSPDDAERLLHATEGWVAGLQLASLSLRDRSGSFPIAQAGRDVDAYLAENVVPQVPQAALDFLLATSVLDRLCPALCDAVTGRHDGREMLDWLEARNLFIRPVDDGATWYRYHALFRDHLARRVQRRGDAAALHAAASRWFAAQALWPEAVRHALAAGDSAQAAAWVEQCAMRLVENGDAQPVLAWVAKLPPQSLAGRVQLRLAHAWALAMTLQTDDVAPALESLRADIAAGSTPPSDAACMELLAVSGVAAAMADDSVQALRIADEVAALRPEEGSWAAAMATAVRVYGHAYASRFDEARALRAQSPPAPLPGRPVHAQVYLQAVFGMAAWLEGDLQEAVRLFEQALAYAEASVGRVSAAAALPAGYLAVPIYERNDLERVAELLRDRVDLVSDTTAISSVMGMTTASARLAALRGDLDGARRWLDGGIALATGRRWMRMVAMLTGEAVRLDLRDGRAARAQQTVERLAAMLPAEPPAARDSVREAWHLMRAAQGRVLLARGHADDAVAMLEQVAAAWCDARMAYREARGRIALAIACDGAGRPAAAAQEMTKALAYAQRQGLVRSFVDEGEPARKLVAALQRDRVPGLDASYLSGLLEAFGPAGMPAAPATAPAAAAPAARLSAREVEILDFIAQGLSNKEIARALRVAPETIKWHLKNIYEKLNVSTRVQAVQCGLGMDLPLRGAGVRS
jgi:LuxR family maltose regulon positive regulatory protein